MDGFRKRGEVLHATEANLDAQRRVERAGGGVEGEARDGRRRPADRTEIRPSPRGTLCGVSDVTRILAQWEDLDDPAADLLPLVYGQLRAMARSRMRHERVGHTLQATALVHEAYLKLMDLQGDAGAAARDRRRFFAAAGEAMRRLTIDHARRRNAAKRGGGGGAKIALDALGGDVPDPKQADTDDRLIALGEALDVLEAEDPRAAEVVKLRHFAGLTVAEVAAAMEVSVRTVEREWTFARARLLELVRHADA